ncbi:unnamed protein product [Arctogadus glacialis]
MLVLLVQVDVEQLSSLLISVQCHKYSTCSNLLTRSRWRSEPSPGLRKSRVCSPELDLIHQGGREGPVGATGEISTGGAGNGSIQAREPPSLTARDPGGGRCVSEFSPEQGRQHGDVEEEKEGRSGRFSLLC